MDSLPQVNMEFDKLKSTVDNTKVDWQLLLRITADFSIKIGVREFYHEVDFPIVEFSTQAMKWAKSRQTSFYYKSMESDNNPLIEFRSLGGDKFVLRSSHQEFEANGPVIGLSLNSEVCQLVRKLLDGVQVSFGIRLDHLFE